MPNSQASSLLLLGVAVVLFFFSLTLLPLVEQYCRFQRPAIVLLILQIALLGIHLRVSRANANSGLVVAAFVFTALGLMFNVALLLMARGKC